VTCREMSEFLLEYVGGELRDDVLAQFERHLADCGNCHQYLVQYKASIRAGQLAFADPDADASTEAPADLIKAILDTLDRTP
jgi:anti-sigma factor RsiW